MFENVVLAQKSSLTASVPHQSPKPFGRLLTAQNSKLEFFENIFKIWLDWAKIYGFWIWVSFKPVYGRILRIYFSFSFLWVFFLCRFYYRQFNCLIMVMIHHQSPTSRFNKRMTHQMTHKWFLMIFLEGSKNFKIFLRQILSSSTRFEQKEKFKLSNLNLDLIRLRPRSAMEDWWRHQLNATVNLPCSRVPWEHFGSDVLSDPTPVKRRHRNRIGERKKIQKKEMNSKFMRRGF